MSRRRSTAQTAGPARRVLLVLGAAVLAAHLGLLSGAAGLTPVLQPAARTDLPPLQTRLIEPAAPKLPAVATAVPVTTRPPSARASARMLAQSTAPKQVLTPAPIQEPATGPANTPEPPQTPAAPEAGLTPPVAAASTARSDTRDTPVAVTADTPGDEPGPLAGVPPANAPSRTELVAAPDRPTHAIEATAKASDQVSTLTMATEAGQANAKSTTSSTSQIASAFAVDRAHLPPPLALDYEMTGMDRGLSYHASGELRWQHNEERYNLSLTVRALLLGSREWRSQGLIGSQGLQPQRFSDKRRSERATHFDREGGRVVFSGSAAPVPLAPGAQDQISLYVQMAAAIASAATPMTVGTQLQVQTATTRDALPWLLTLERHETLRFEGAPLDTAYWVCMPRQRFDARIELWTSPLHHHLPARIRITQASGSFIDLQLRSLKALAPLPA